VYCEKPVSNAIEPAVTMVAGVRKSKWDYGGGSITDWGVPLTDVMLWYRDADRKTPLPTSASAVNAFNRPDPERVPDSDSITWKFDNFVATFTDAVPPSGGPAISRSDMHGDWFYGRRGVILVNRFGHELRPVVQAPGGGGAPENIPEPLKPERVRQPKGSSENPDSKFGSATMRHPRKFLDCVKSRQKLVCDMGTGFNSTLPKLLAVLSIRQGRSFTWDGTTARPA
jgi:predicted dehydrogenase